MDGALWIDVFLFAAFAAIVVIYTVRGFAKSVIGFVVMVAALLTASLLGPLLGGLLYDGFMFDAVGSIVTSALDSLGDSVAGAVDGEAIIEALPEAVRNLLSFAGVELEELSEQLISSSGIAHAVEAVAGPVARFISNLLSYILIFAVSLFVFKLVSKLVLRVFELPVLRTLNRLAGFLMGLLVGFLACWGIALALRLVFGMISLSNPAFLSLADPSGTYLYYFFTGIGS